MAKISKQVINELAYKALSGGNPYIARATEFFIDRVPHYIYADEIMTKEQIDKAYLDTARKDIENGFKERMVGYYDKWYRYCRTDEGRAYDLGVRYAADDVKCSAEFNIIPA